MPALNFQKQWAKLVACGLKRQTIRATRKRPIKQGDMLYLYTGMRTRQCEALGITHCMHTAPIKICSEQRCVYVSGKLLSPDGVEQLARADGFLSTDDFFAYFATPDGRAFEGQLIKWPGAE